MESTGLLRFEVRVLSVLYESLSLVMTTPLRLFARQTCYLYICQPPYVLDHLASSS